MFLRKREQKNKIEFDEQEIEDSIPLFIKKKRKSDENTEEFLTKKSKKLKKTTGAKVLFIVRSGIDIEYRYFTKELLNVIPLVQQTKKFNDENSYQRLNSIADKFDINNIIFCEMLNNQPILWIGIYPTGPTICFRVETMHRISDLNTFVNVTSRTAPVILFDKKFDESSTSRLFRETLDRVFSVNPFGKGINRSTIDTVISFFLVDGHIWFRRYRFTCEKKAEVYEVGPRFCLKPLVVKSGCFMKDDILWKNK